ncbi:hypothetical protein ABW636_08165 [Aquimarina sp. 2201CG1-2-11]|uniref:hypothetical protein n=1 Tax=Aquimarina discodermiae TaxID=3231043 RepID=UPI0034637B72
MLFPRTNIEQELGRLRDKKIENSNWRQQVYQILNENYNTTLKDVVGDQKTSSIPISENTFDFDLLETHNIYHIDQIKKICIDYRLRFLDLTYFKGKIPKRVITTIKSLEEQHTTKLLRLKIVAPSKLFKLENMDDPLLFAPMGNDYFYLVDKWGDDLHPLRKFFMWFFKSFENLLFLTFLISLLLTFMVPIGLFSKQSDTTTFIITFFFMFKSVAAIVLFYGVALGKNFNTAIWNSRYFNA